MNDYSMATKKIYKSNMTLYDQQKLCKTWFESNITFARRATWLLLIYLITKRGVVEIKQN